MARQMVDNRDEIIVQEFTAHISRCNHNPLAPALCSFLSRIDKLTVKELAHAQHICVLLIHLNVSLQKTTTLSIYVT